MLNRVVLIGRLTRDPELRYTQSGKAVCSFTLAVDRTFKNAQGEKEADFIDITVWNQQGENCANYLAKGKLAAVDGSLRIRTYTGNDGINRKAIEVIADTVRFLSPKDGNSGNSSYNNAPSTYNAPSAPANNDMSYNNDDMLGDDDLPF